MPVKPKMTWQSKTHTWFGKYRKQRFSVSCRQREPASSSRTPLPPGLLQEPVACVKG